MCGGVSHIDTFDPKDNKWAGKLIDVVGFGDNLAEMRRPVIPCHRTFTRYGKSGIPVSDWFPHVGGVIDEIAVVRSMWCHEGNHFPAVIETCTGHRGRAVRPPDLRQLGLVRPGQRQQEPADVREHRPAVVAGATDRRLPRRDRGRHPVPGRARRRSRTCIRPAGGSAAERERQMQALAGTEPRVPRALRHQLGHRGPRQGVRAGRPHAARRAGGRRLLRRAEARARTSTASASKETDDFGRQLLLARRLAERGVRFIQVCHAGGGNGGWDAHGDIKTHAPLCRATDKPIAGLIRDLKQRGMLDETLVVWTSEFGRSPWSQNTTGRDHNPKGYTSWLAGGGVKGGVVHGATDDVGYKAVENPHYYSDLHATILQQLGLDYQKMEVPVLGRTMKLVEEGHGPIQEILTS